MRILSSIVGASVCLAAGCGGATPQGAVRAPAIERAASADVDARTPRAASDSRAPRGETAIRGNEPASSELDEKFAVTRQVTALERSIELYQAFIVRAGDDPRYAEAVRRSRGRIDDARLTICFLLDRTCEESAPR